MLAAALKEKGFRLVSGGTDNHLMLLDMRSKEMTGKEAEGLLDEAGVTVNKNTIPFDPQSPFVTSGIRIGTPAVTTRGMKEPEMGIIAEITDLVITYRGEEEKLARARTIVKELTGAFPLVAHDRF